MKKIILFTAISLSALISSAQCTADFTWSVSGSNVQITNTSSGVDSYDWSFGDGASSSATNPSHNYSSAGTYDICLYAFYMDSMGGFCNDSICHTVTVFQDSTGGMGCSVSANIYENNGQIIGTNTSSGADYYGWTVFDYNSGATLTTANTPNLNYSPGYYGNFWVCLDAYDSTGFICDSLCEMITIASDSLDSNLFVLNQNLLDFQLYPNPTNAILNIQFDHAPSTAHALIVDLLGREMIELNLSDQRTEVSVADFPIGVYIVQIVDESSYVIGIRKFIRN